MAKVKLPLMGVMARGQIAKSVVFFPWKGVQAVRMHVFPAQPRTEDQLEVRADFKSHVDAWHDAQFKAVDKAAWNLYAGVTKRAASGFNEFVGFFRKAYDAALQKSYARDMEVTANTGGSMTMTINVSDDTVRDITLYYGYSKTYIPYTATATQSAGNVWTVTITDLVVGAELYFFWMETVATHYGRTGIYKEEVAA